ncbi:hypothetical protein AAFF_G00368180 [Aldrovandia affinis]|uniref:Transmembrane protein 144 n=1 Tax=Aldrovandia affinis TaxID=143900 RepID=A0AAD7WNB3_9TELE|nr:hypothetical protein AAFF_G00368180 [Aldrovandia affinis]
MRIFSSLTCTAALLLSTASALAHGPGLGNHKLQYADQVGAGLPMTESNATHPGATDSWSMMKGFFCLGLCVIGYGTSLVPLKNTDTGDGLFFQWVFCSSLWMGSFLAHTILGCPRVWLLSVLGGMLWSIGNLATIPILKTVGLGVGYLIWSVSTLLIGWATASCLILFLVKTEIEQGEREEREPLIKMDYVVSDENILEESNSNRAWVDRLSSKQRKPL